MLILINGHALNPSKISHIENEFNFDGKSDGIYYCVVIYFTSGKALKLPKRYEGRSDSQKEIERIALLLNNSNK